MNASHKIIAAVPVKETTDAKQRLAGVLPGVRRQQLALAMLEDVLAALVRVPELAGILVVTADRAAASLAARHGAHILAEVKGYGLTSDAYHISSPREDGSGASRAMSKALEDAGIGPEVVDYIAAHGTGTPMNDVIETKAIKAALGESASKVAISSIKSLSGHSIAAAGVLSTIASIKGSSLVPGFPNM